MSGDDKLFAFALVLSHPAKQLWLNPSFFPSCSCRAHLNDVENNLPFLFLGAVYTAIGPSLAVARLHFLVFFVGRVVHSIAYLFALRAPTRSVSYTVAQIPCVSMAVQILLAVAAYAWVQKFGDSLFFLFCLVCLFW